MAATAMVPPAGPAAAAAAAAATPIVFEGVDTIAGSDRAADQRFLAWALANGVRAPKLIYPWWDPATGVRGLGAAEDIGPGG